MKDSLKNTIYQILERLKLPVLPDYALRTTLHEQTWTSGSNDLFFTGTVSKNGFLQIKISTNNAGLLPFWRLTLNGKVVHEISKYGNASGDVYMYRWSPLFPVKAGDTYRAQMAGGICTVFLYNAR